MAKYLDNSGLARVWDKVKSHVSGQPFVRYDSQSLSDAYKLQARTNIDAAKSDAHTNDNLLDNAYFVGGGSQLGDGVFPINQRGQTSYSNSSHGIDRWVGNYTLNAGYLTVNGFMYQIASYPLGVPLTFSAMLENGSVVGGTLTITETTTQEYFYTDGNTIQLVKASGGGALMVWTGSSVNVKAVKLEVGTVSTLANDAPPDYGEELAKCQRYFMRLNYTSVAEPIGYGYAYSTSQARILIPTPVPMRANPTISATATANLRINCNGTYLTPSGFTATGTAFPNGIAVHFGISGATSGALALLFSYDSMYIDFSADL